LSWAESAAVSQSLIHTNLVVSTISIYYTFIPIAFHIVTFPTQKWVAEWCEIAEAQNMCNLCNQSIFNSDKTAYMQYALSPQW